MAHMTHEEESAIDLNGNSYIIDFSAMQQVGIASIIITPLSTIILFLLSTPCNTINCMGRSMRTRGQLVPSGEL